MFTGFSKQDFAVFQVEGLENRMKEIKEIVRPKLVALGEYFTPSLSQLTNNEMFYHVAKHARRKVNPPNDTWVAFSSSKRGYKPLPHFQIGLFETHVFVWFALIYESPLKETYAKQFLEHVPMIKDAIPSHFVWSMDHTKPNATPHYTLSTEDLISMGNRLESIKKAELLCGIHISNHDPILLNKDACLETIENTFEALLPLYRLAGATSVNI